MQVLRLQQRQTNTRAMLTTLQGELAAAVKAREAEAVARAGMQVCSRLLSLGFGVWGSGYAGRDCGSLPVKRASHTWPGRCLPQLSPCVQGRTGSCSRRPAGVLDPVLQHLAQPPIC